MKTKLPSIPLQLLILAAALLAGCSASRQAARASVQVQIQKDTIYFNRVQYDSIYVDNRQLTDRSRDTVYLEKIRMEYKYKILRDTVRIVKTDTIPVIKEVVKEVEAEKATVKPERYIPKIYKWSLGICITIIIALIILAIWKIKF